MKAKFLLNTRIIGYWSEFIISGILIVLIVTGIVTGNDNVAAIVTGVFVLVAYVIFERWLSKQINRLLLEDLDLDNYKQYFVLLAEKAPFPVRKKEAKEVADYILGNDTFLKGEFVKAEQILRQVRPEKIRALYRKSIANGTRDLLELSRVYLGQDLAGGIQNPKTQAIAKILKKEPTSYFDSYQPENKLQAVQKSYYQGLNALNQGDKKTALVHFQAISQENPELFYVREAKHYIEGENHG